MFKNYNDNIALSAISSIDKNYMSQGLLRINEDDAVEIAEKVFISNYYLNDDFSIKDFSPVSNTPLLKTYIINETNTNFTTDEGVEFFIKNPTVIIYTECKPKGMIVSRNITLKNYSIYEVFFKESPTQLIISSENRFIDLNISMKEIVNPYRFNNTHTFNEIDWYFPTIPMSSGGSFVFGLKSDNYNVQNFEGIAEFRGINNDNSEYLFLKPFSSEENNDILINVPENCPLNTTVSLSVYATAINNATNEVSLLNFPPNEEDVFIGRVENNINELLMFVKIK
ncbi:MAG: hypothetical protein GX947_06000 [Tissierellia bacterium]|nr:hypothetical protein [Tissierellia bacterium]